LAYLTSLASLPILHNHDLQKENMLKKIFKAAKKAAPVIGAGLGFLYGGPMLGSAIGGGLGSLVAGKSPEEALKFAAMAGLTGGALSKFGGMQAGQGLGGLFGRTAATSTAVPSSILNATSSGNAIAQRVALKDAIMKGAVSEPSIFSKGLGLIKANPIQSALAGLGIAGAVGAGGEESETIDIEKVYGTQSPFRDLGGTNITPNRLIPFGSANKPYGLADGGIIGLANGGDFPRKNGPIAGPGTETSDEIPAMLSDGEFVINARTVRGLGAAMGAKNKEEERDRGSNFLYSIQNNYGAKA
tara:strand:+ start:339 stop:1241 length:903 start_codon:yes stop_codon:yes gene_type:complete